MRIINGYLSGRKTIIPRNFRARPTTDMARSALFNILRNRIDFEVSTVLDLFSGSGSLSYEFASLGCPQVTAVEKDHQHCEGIRKNISLLDITTIRVMQTDVFLFLNRNRERFDVIVADPPYYLPRIPELPSLILSGDHHLKPDGLLILEHGPGITFDNHLDWQETRVYGKVRFSFFQH